MKKKTKVVAKAVVKRGSAPAQSRPPRNAQTVFVEVHVNGMPVYISIATILKFAAYGERVPPQTLITFVDGSTLIIDESPDQLMKAIILRLQSR